MDFLVKEVLYLLDYENNIKETLFISTDRRTPGYAYEINIKDYNTGYSDLSFKMPCDIINENGEKEKNPKLALLVPLSKVRYNRTIRYMGKDKIGVPEPDGSTKIFPEEDGNRLLENYTMDYIIQPLDKSRQGIGISLTYTAIDFPRFNLSKKKVGLTFNENTITTQELSLYKNTPLSVPGSIQYVPWLENGEPATWDPNAQAKTYPLDEDAIKKLVNETHFSYGILATVYYWPVTSSGRFEGVWYEEGGFITLSLYNTYAGSDWEGSDYLESISHDWGHLDPIEHYLGPNNACNYLRYILKDTNWKVAGHQKLFIKNTEEQPWFAKGVAPSIRDEGTYYIEYQDLGNDKYETTVYRSENGKWEKQTDKTFEQIVNTDINDPDFGTLYDIDIEQVEVSRSAEASLGQTLYTDARYSLSVSNANCYNAITSEAKLFDLYPVFNCIERTVSLKLNVGKDYGLTYRYKSNLKNSTVKVDGEKVITKLYVTGGSDAQGDQNITIGEANRITSGTPANLVTEANKAEYLKSSIIPQMETLEKNIYDHISGLALTTGVNMSNQKFKLTFPDNLFDTEKTNTAQTTKKIIGFSSGKSINKIYNPTGKDYCYYIYIRHNADDDYKDEKNQLYKFDGANITLRRNLEEYFLQDIGTVNFIASGETNITNNIKYCPTLDSRVTQDGNMYIGTVIDYSTKDGEYTLSDVNTHESFVLVGPDRVYKVPAGASATYNYGVGNYYYIEDTNTYRYCAIQYTDTKSIYSKINNISVNGYVFVEMGAPTDMLYITVNDIKGQVFKIVEDKLVGLTLADWFVNDFSLRVIFDGANLVSGGSFDPNADEYITSRSPYGTSYIYNFKYLYDNDWMTEADILDIYAKNKELNDINLEFYDRYTKDLVNIQAAYNDAINNYDIYSSKADAQLEALMSQYWVNPNKASDGQFSAFPGMPADVNTDNYDTDKEKYYMDITYEEPQGDGTTKTMVVKRVYFDVFNTKSCDKYPSCKDNKTVADNPYTEGQYHVVAKALGWEDNYAYKLTINSEIGGYTESEDPSKTADSYNKFVKQMKEYYYRALEADKQMVEAQAALDELMERYKEWENQIAQIEKYLQENYGEYIIEGSYSNDEQPYANLLLKDGLDASDKYATPDITYTVGVVDASGLIEYRAPHKLVCNDLIKRLHGVGQIAPHVGDYVAIQDEPMGMYGVAGLITQIGRRIDNPYQNTITIDTSYTDADELVGNIITATNTVLSNKDIYGRAAIINNKGELSSTTVSNALSTGTNSISIISTSGKVAVDDNGVTCTNPHNQNEVMRYNGTGILGSNNGGATWRELLTQDGINANYINAGTINASKVSITDGGHDITVMNADGLVVKSQANKPYVLGNLNADGVTKAFENITVFIGRAENGEGIGYFNGYINATKGGNIAGWTIKSSALHTKDNALYLGTSGITATINGASRDNLVFKAGNNFGVTADGNLHAAGANVSGKITITDAASNLNQGTIAGFTAGSNGLTQGRIVLSPAGGAIKAAVNTTYTCQSNSAHVFTNYFDLKIVDGKLQCPTCGGAVTGSGGSGERSDWAIFANGNFGVTTAGHLYATNADIAGKIKANSGSIGGWTIGSSSESAAEKKKSLYYGTFGADKSIYLIPNGSTTWKSIAGEGASNWVLTIGNDFGVKSSGAVYARSGKIGGWTLGTSSITNGNTTLGSTGKISFSSGSAFFAMGDGSNHPVASSLSVKSTIGFYTNLSVNGGGTYQGHLAYDTDNIILRSNGGVGVMMVHGDSGVDSTGKYNNTYRFELAYGSDSKLNATIRAQGGIYLRGAGNDSLHIYGSYNNESKYHIGQSGIYDVDTFLGGGKKLCFVNGIFVGLE